MSHFCKYRNFGCGKAYKQNGKCLSKHESGCQFKHDARIIPVNETTTTHKIYCSYCDQQFVKIANHKCKARNCVPGAVFKFEDDFFVNNDDSQCSFDSSLLNIGFTSEKAACDQPVTPTDFVGRVFEFSKSHNKELKVGLININGIYSKMHEIAPILNHQLVDVLVVNETKLDDTVDSAEFENLYYHLYRRDRTRHGGGLFVYVKNCISIYALDFDQEAEIISLQIAVNSLKIGIIACYRPESINCNLFFDKLEKHTLDLVANSNNIMIIGDLNYNLLESQPNQLTNFMNSFGFYNTIKEGTRTNPITKVQTLLDVILTLCISSFLTSCVFHNSFSDHALIITTFKYGSSKPDSCLLKSRCLSKNRLRLIKRALQLCSFDHLARMNDVDELWLYIRTTITTIVDLLAPIKNCRIKPNGVAWFDGDLNKLHKKREYFHNKYLSTKDDADKKRYVDLRNKFNSAYRRKKAGYFQGILEEFGTSSRSLWAKLYPILNPNKKSTLNSVRSNGKLYNAPAEIARIFLETFSTAIASFVHLPLVECLRYSRVHLDNQRLEDPAFSTCTNQFSFRPIHPGEMKRRILNLDKSSSQGFAGIPTKVLNHCSDELTLPLTLLFRACILSKRFPNELKVAMITPIFKGKGDKNSLDNYRPISVLSPVAKIFEKILCDQLTNHLEANYLFRPAQHGFRRKLSCETAMNAIVEHWRHHGDQKRVAISVFLDLKKAFDTVNHDLLLFKLHYYQVHPSVTNLISSYLHHRPYVVNFKNATSKSAILDTVVPQGSALGPLLFLLFINDLMLIDLVSQLVLFADDTTITATGIDYDEAKDNIYDDLKLISDWLAHNRLTVNWSKTNFMVIGSADETNQLPIDDVIIERVKHTRLLGVEIDDELKFDRHITNICSKINRKAFVISRRFFLFNKKFKSTLFKLFLMPHFEYCSSIFALTTSENRTRLDKCFTKNIKLFLNVNIKDESTRSQECLLRDYKIQPLVLRLFFHLCMFLHSSFFNECVQVTCFFKRHTAPYQLRYQMIAPVIHKRFGANSLTHIGTIILNSFLTPYLKTPKSDFRNHLYDNCFYYHEKLENFCKQSIQRPVHLF